MKRCRTKFNRCHLETLESRALLTAITPLAAPLALTAAVQSPTKVALHWTDNDSSATGYSVLRSTDGVHYAQAGQINSGNSESYTDTNAKSGTSYYYEVEAIGSNSALSAASNPAACTTPLAAPSALIVAIQNNTSLQLKWNTNDSSATGYYVLRSTDGTTFSKLATLTSSNANSYTDSAVSSGYTYTYAVQSFNAVATSLVSNLATLAPLGAPSGLTVAIQNNTSLQLKWNNNGSAAAGYYVLRSTDGTNFSLLATLNSSGANNYTDHAVSSGYTYTYEVEAYSAFATSPVSNRAALPPLAAPSSLTLAALSSTSEQLTWKDNASSATGYQILRSTDGATFSLLTTLSSSNASSYTDNTGIAGVTYTYEVDAFNAFAKSPVSNSATLAPMLAPSALTLTIKSSSSIQLNWNDNAASAAGYFVLRSTNGGSFSQLVQLTSSSANSYTDNTVGPGVTYTYEVQAFNSVSTSALSNAVSTVLPTYAPSSLATAVAGSSVNLTWTDNDTSAAGYRVLRSSDGASFTQIATINSGSAASFADTTVSAGQTRYYEVEAYYSNGATSAVSNVASAFMPTHAPSSLAAAATGSWVNLTWTDNDTLAAGYLVLRSSDGVNFTQIATLNSGSAASYADMAVSAGQTYYYEVQAYYGSGAISAVSNVASITAPSGQTGGNVAITTRYANELIITASGLSDTISVVQSGSTLTIVADGQAYSESIPTGGVFIYARSGSDWISVDQSVVTNVTVETIDGVPDTITSAGANVFAWIDSSDTFSGTGTVRRVSSFAGGVSKAQGASLANPSDSGATTAVNLSLFGTGPAASDVNQGEVGDCYFVSSLAAFAGEKPSVLTTSAVDMGDGTYVVDFNNTFVRVSNQFANGPFGGFEFTHPGSNNTIWAMVMEKAFAYYRTGANTYASISSGWMSEVYSDLGVSASTFYFSGYSASTFYNAMASDLAGGKAVTFGTYGSPPNLVGNHAYTLVGVYQLNGVNYYEVRNPWGMSGDGLEDSRGYATLTYAQVVANFMAGCQAVS